MPVEYYSNLGSSIQKLIGSSGSSSPGTDDWAFVTSGGSGTRPTLVHVCTSPSSTLRPTYQVRTGTDDVFYRFQLPLKPKQTRALCCFHLQRNSEDDAEEAMKDFSLAEEMAKVPADIAALLANMPADSVQIGKAPPAPEAQTGLRPLREGRAPHGEDPQHVVPHQGPPRRAGPARGSRRRPAGPPRPGESWSCWALTDGQIVSGEWLNGPLKLAGDEAGKGRDVRRRRFPRRDVGR